MDALTDQLIRLIDIRLLDPLEILLASPTSPDSPIDPVRALVATRAGQWAHVLRGDDEQAARFLAIRLVSTLHPGDSFTPPAEWWQTPLGQIVARRVGHPTAAAVPYSVAGAMLGISRQGVHDLAVRGKLVRHPEGGVTTDSVRTRLLSREEKP